MNFFSWIRDGVRQAVLYGVADAVGDIGTPPNGEDVGQRLLEVIRSSDATTVAAGNQLGYATKREKARPLAERHPGRGEESRLKLNAPLPAAPATNPNAA